MTSKSHRSLLLTLAAFAIVLGAALAGSRAASAKDDKPFRADVKHHVLIVQGGDTGTGLVLRLRAGKPDQLEVDGNGDGEQNVRHFNRKEFSSIEVRSGAGNDGVTIDETNGVFTDTEPTTIDGQGGNDRLTGGSGAETFIGGDGSDFVDGNKGDDIASLGAADDAFRWDPGDGSDRVEGEAGNDTLEFVGANVGENVDLSANGGRLRFFRDVANVTMDTAGVETVAFEALGGADSVTVHDLTGTDVTEVDTDLAATPGEATGDGQSDTVRVQGTNGDDRIEAAGEAGEVSVRGLSARVEVSHAEPASDLLSVEALDGADSISATTLKADAIGFSADGGKGTDTLLGGDGNDTLSGGDGNDFADGNKGNDSGVMGAGDDVFQWDPGDGSDAIQGGAGLDTMLFNDANIAESVDLSANTGRLHLFRNIGNVTMDSDDVEIVDIRALGGADNLTVGDLTGTDVTNVETDVGAADGQPDTVRVKGTNGDDVIAAVGQAGEATVTGLPALVEVSHAEPANDSLAIESLGGNDSVSAATLKLDAIEYAADGGTGNDTLLGGDGNDTLTGGEGDDFADGNKGNDLGVMGQGDDVFQWDPGDGSDAIEGGAGHDTMLFNDANIAEDVDLSAIGGRLHLFRNVGNVTMDSEDVEVVDIRALGGADSLTVNDLSTTDVTEVKTDLGVGDNQPDTVRVKGTNGDDAVAVSATAGAVSVNGLAAAVKITNAEAANDTLAIEALAGDDLVGAVLPVGVIKLSLDGGEGDDGLIGGDGDDVLSGGAGDDILIGGLGADQITCGDGADTVISDVTDIIAADC